MAPAKEVAQGIGAHGRSKSYHRRGLWALKKKNGGKFPVHPKQEKAAAEASKKPAKFYPAEDAPQPLARRVIRRAAKLRPSITPGTVLILLAGRFKGKRVVFLGQLPSGLLLVTGPFKLNGVPVRRVNQAYVIATSTKVDVSGVDTSKFDDAYFKSAEKKQKKQTEEGFFAEKTEKAPLPAEYVANQKAVDAALMGKLSDELKGYLSTRFTLRSGDRPHLMKF
ncbi:60S ribosomal L6 [Chlorella sorokiniana]|jgi:large subunit ribosomal protein L6e|uniref:60S ribosomal L6 n=1 Tax=Chlorella sorokiniana TaxID=3076 RepID=A0A2P6TUJ4_CHLSO|nr:60S ribosomal L6 [Chlorella sorokiniana]|eukprot:PRW57743.1 60S ribosomal L6 [Chlorella sorokiniana]